MGFGPGVGRGGALQRIAGLSREAGLASLAADAERAAERFPSRAGPTGIGGRRLAGRGGDG